MFDFSKESDVNTVQTILAESERLAREDYERSQSLRRQAGIEQTIDRLVVLRDCTQRKLGQAFCCEELLDSWRANLGENIMFNMVDEACKELFGNRKSIRSPGMSYDIVLGICEHIIRKKQAELEAAKTEVSQ